MTNETEIENQTEVSRRGFFKIAGVAAAGLAGAAAFGAAGTAISSPRADAAPKIAPIRIKESFSYKGRTLQIMDMNGGEMLHVNGKAIEHHLFNKTGAGYMSHLLPYESHKDAKTLAKRLVDEDGVLFYL